ncbi:hypothetical protein EV180_006584 [Coemansia sp. RSA 518]|nr:hypothetical protein EV181_006774 [Coemansia sp. RSA 532]KAJ2195776.1 hypothetical protein IW144_003278 [Coemansia sp. RSA 522]KAJ2209886.1 hypothetical protein EV180_006584 [Coemansia sp. RSA 518]KAJ2288793.1 hypothetical protein IW141_004187 [Coemansia sp. RSA 355]
MAKTDSERLCHHLVLLQVLDEYCTTNARGFTSSYIRLGRNSSCVIQGQRPIVLRVSSGKPKASAASKAKPKKSAKPSAKGKTASWNSDPSTSRASKRSTSPSSSASSSVATNSTSKHFRAAKAGSTTLKAMSFRNANF